MKSLTVGTAWMAVVRFTCIAGLVWRGPDLEEHICDKQGEDILAPWFLAFRYYKLIRNLVIAHRNVDLEWTSHLLSQVNF